METAFGTWKISNRNFLFKSCDLMFQEGSMSLINFVDWLGFYWGRVVFCFPSFVLPLGAHYMHPMCSSMLVLLALLTYSLVCLSKKKGQSKSLFKKWQHENQMSMNKPPPQKRALHYQCHHLANSSSSQWVRVCQRECSRHLLLK